MTQNRLIYKLNETLQVLKLGSIEHVSERAVTDEYEKSQQLLGTKINVDEEEDEKDADDDLEAIKKSKSRHSLSKHLSTLKSVKSHKDSSLKTIQNSKNTRIKTPQSSRQHTGPKSAIQSPKSAL